VSIELLAIAPPSGAIDLRVLDVWREAGLRELAVLLREPGARPTACVTGRLGPLREACVDAGLRVLVAVDADAIAAAVDVVVAHGLAGMQVRGDPSEEVLVRARDSIGGRLLGRSVHGDPDALHGLVDYSVFAPVFAPRTEEAKAAAGLPALQRWTADPRAWIVALGGVTASTAGACVDAGARGVASISSFFAATHAAELERLAAALR
jgi:thiamine monophosphate synthase